MGGNGSGRKSNYEKAKEGKLKDLCVDYLVDNFNQFDAKTKLKISLNLASKIMPQTQNINQTIEEKNEQDIDNIYEAMRRLNEEDIGDAIEEG